MLSSSFQNINKTPAIVALQIVASSGSVNSTQLALACGVSSFKAGHILAKLKAAGQLRVMTKKSLIFYGQGKNPSVLYLRLGRKKKAVGKKWVML